MQKHPQHCLSKHPPIIVRFCKCLVYHVMNYGEGCAFIFHGKAYTDVFLQSFIEAHEQFGFEGLCKKNKRARLH